MSANILGIFVILALAVPAVGRVYAQVSPTIKISTSNNYLRADNFAPNTTVTFTIYASQDTNEDPVWTDSMQTDENGFAIIWPWDEPQPPDLVVGNYVVVKDDTGNEKQLMLEPLTIDVFNPDADFVAGRASPGESVWVVVGNDTVGYPAGILAEANANGIWIADFAQVYDFSDDMWGSAEVADDDWDVTVYHLGPTPNPWLIAFPENDAVEAWEWPEGATVYLTIDNAPEGFIREGTAEVTTWGDPRTYVRFEFSGEYDLQVGDVVTLTDEFGATTTHTVQYLSVTTANHDDDTIKGIADPGAKVYVWPHATGEQQLAIAKTKGAAKGKWNVDFSGIYDIAPGECGRSEIRDEFGNSTAVDWCISNPTFVAYMPVTIVGYDWPIGDTIDISINNDEYTARAEVGNADWDPTVVLFELWRDDFFMEAGDHIVMTDRSARISKEVWVTNLAVSDFDLSEGEVFGTYDPAYNLWVWLYDLEGQVPETDPDSGTWIATFTELPPGAWGGATQWDGDGDGTSMDFQVPDMRVVIANQPDWVDSGVTVSAGQSFTIEASGLMNPCSDTYPNGADYCIFYSPQGAEGVVPDENEFGVFPGPGLRFMALLGRIGDGEPFYIGEGGAFTTEQAGTLWFTPNDNLRTDNQGAYGVLVWLDP
jgi:hypothetical protein